MIRPSFVAMFLPLATKVIKLLILCSANSGIQVLASPDELRFSPNSFLAEGGVVERTFVVSSDALAVEVETARPLAGWQKLSGSFEALRDCPPGYSLDPKISRGGLGCSPCAAGLYSNVSGGKCVSCPPGTANTISGQIECSPCAEGMFQQYEGQLQCHACEGTVSTDATECFKSSGWPVYAYVVLAVVLAGLLTTIAVASLKFWATTLQRIRGGYDNHFIEFEQLEFDRPPVVLGTGSLGLVLAAKYRSFPVAVKQIKHQKGYSAFTYYALNSAFLQREYFKLADVCFQLRG
jgi:hypothetical protein